MVKQNKYAVFDVKTWLQWILDNKQYGFHYSVINAHTIFIRNQYANEKAFLYVSTSGAFFYYAPSGKSNELELNNDPNKAFVKLLSVFKVPQDDLPQGVVVPKSKRASKPTAAKPKPDKTIDTKPRKRKAARKKQVADKD